MNLSGTSKLLLLTPLLLFMQACTSPVPNPAAFTDYVIDYSTAPEPNLQEALTAIDANLREKHGIGRGQAAVGVLDLRQRRLAWISPDQEFYGASVPKIAILLTFFELHPEIAANLPAETRHELGLMIKRSSNEMAAKYSQLLGLANIRQVLDKYHLYDAAHGGGIWVGKHYGVSGERVGDPIADHSHAATVRQLLRFCLLLEQQKLVSPQASRVMQEIFASPEIRHEKNKFVKGLDGLDREVLRKSGSWEDWLHDLAMVRGPGRHYVLAALTQHPKGDDYLADLAPAVDDALGH